MDAKVLGGVLAFVAGLVILGIYALRADAREARERYERLLQ